MLTTERHQQELRAQAGAAGVRTSTLKEGEIFGLIGPNAAGKITVFNLITGQGCAHRASAFNDDDIGAVAPHKITERGIARTFQNIRVFKEMTLLENVVVGMHEHLNYGVASMLFNLGGFAKQRRKPENVRWNCCPGCAWTTRRTCWPIVCPMASSASWSSPGRWPPPKLLLLDEPVAGMKPAEATELMSEIVNIKQRISPSS
jgi:branched-chain amino acid transport system ATP-binding protein